MKYAFPAIFVKDSQTEGAINVVFPDILGAYTFGMGEKEAMEMAKDLLCTLLEQEEIKHIKPSLLTDIDKKLGTVLLVEVEK